MTNIINQKIPVILLLTLLVASCASLETETVPVPEDYEQTVNEWKEYRIDRLTEPTGWLRLTDLIWLEEGENRFGSGENMGIRFPEGTIPEYAGVFTLDSGIVHMNVADDVLIENEGEPVDEKMIFDGENRPEFTHEDLIWYVDTRGDQHGIRLYNQDSPEADQFEGFPFYPLDPEWHLKGRFVPAPDGHTITIVNVLGDTIERESPGSVEFRVDGELYSLDAFESASGLFLMFTDQTNRTDTYQAGRYMIIDLPDENGHTIIDFNKAYNPPCAFSKLTTCQLPPPQNRLDLTIPAGEQRPVGWEGREFDE